LDIAHLADIVINQTGCTYAEFTSAKTEMEEAFYIRPFNGKWGYNYVMDFMATHPETILTV